MITWVSNQTPISKLIDDYNTTSQLDHMFNQISIYGKLETELHERPRAKFSLFYAKFSFLLR